MLHLISKTKASDTLSAYTEMLFQVGFVKPGTVKRYLVYLFLIDFVEHLHAFIDEKDYKMIEMALSRIFAGGGCLLPYPVFCSRCATLGSTDYMGTMNTRITEVAEDIRITEDESLRTV